MSATTVLTRKPNWTSAEISALVEAIKPNSCLLKAKFNNNITNEKKQSIWAESKYSKSTSCNRSCQDVKKKWQDLQSSTKKKEAQRLRQMKMTGGDSAPPDLQPWEVAVRDSLPQSVVAGIDGGVDSDEFFDCNSEMAGTPCSSKDLTDSNTSEVKLSIESASLNKNHDSKTPVASTKKRTVQSSDISTRLLQIEEEKLKCLKEIIQLKKRKIETLEDICHQIKQRKDSSEEYSLLSPLINF